MTLPEYEQLNRFETNIEVCFEEFYRSLRITENTIFEIYTLDNDLIQAKVREHFSNFMFDIEPLNTDYRVSSVYKQQIAERIYQGDWRILVKK